MADEGNLACQKERSKYAETALASRHPDLPDNAGSGDDLRRTARMSAKVCMTHRWRDMDSNFRFRAKDGRLGYHAFEIETLDLRRPPRKCLCGS